MRVREFAPADARELRPGHQTSAWWSRAAARARCPSRTCAGRSWRATAGRSTSRRRRSRRRGSGRRRSGRSCGPWTAGAPPRRPRRRRRRRPPCRRCSARGGAWRGRWGAATRPRWATRCGRWRTSTRASTRRRATRPCCSAAGGASPPARARLAAGARNDPHPTWGGTALQLAVAHGQTAAARALLAAAAASGADRAVANHVVVSEDRGGADLRRGDAPLHTAARACDAATAQLLLEHHADPLARDAGGRTAAHVAVAAGRDRGLDVLALLLDAGFAGAVDARDGSDRGEAVLHVACRSGAARCAALLLVGRRRARAGRRGRDAARRRRARGLRRRRGPRARLRGRGGRRRRRRRARPRPSPRSGGSGAARPSWPRPRRRPSGGATRRTRRAGRATATGPRP